MNLTPWKNRSRDLDPRASRDLSPVSNLRSEVNTLFDQFFRDPWFGRTELMSDWSTAWAPSIDVSESEKQIAISVEVPGVDPKNLDINVTGNVLTIQGEKSEQSEKEEKNFYHSERRFGSFRRTIELPNTVDTDSIAAEHKNGVVTITLQKSQGASAKRIPITTSKS